MPAAARWMGTLVAGEDGGQTWTASGSIARHVGRGLVR